MLDGQPCDRQATYEIRVRGSLGLQWSDWFDGFTITTQPNNDTLLRGSVADQAALHGVLAKIRDLGLPLLLVRVCSKQP